TLGKLRLGRGVVVMDYVVIGLANYYQDIFERDSQRIVQIGAGCRIYPWVLVYEGATLGTNVVMEERTSVGSLSVVGRNSRVLYQAQVNDDVLIGRDCVVGGFVADHSRIGNKCSVFGALVHRYENSGSSRSRVGEFGERRAVSGPI